MKNLEYEIVNQFSLDNLANAEYHDSADYQGYISSSQLKDYAKSPRYALYKREHPDEQNEDSAALRFGTLFHDCMYFLSLGGDIDTWCNHLEVFDPPINERTGQPYGVNTKVYTQTLSRFALMNAEKTIVTQQEQDNVVAMVKSLVYSESETSSLVRRLLHWGKPETSRFVDFGNNIKFKVRPDLETRLKIIDWKTTNLEVFDEDSINRAIIRYGYHISAAMYQWVVYKMTGKWKTFYLVMVSKTPPYDAVIVCMDGYTYKYDEDMDYLWKGVGAKEFERLRDLHAECVLDNNYPAAEVFVKRGEDNLPIINIKPPIYLEQKYNDIDE